MAQANHKVAINMRADESLRSLIDTAANLTNKDRTNFILDTMRRESENIVLDQRILKVDKEAFIQLDALMNQPMSTNHALSDLLNSKSPWEK